MDFDELLYFAQTDSLEVWITTPKEKVRIDIIANSWHDTLVFDDLGSLLYGGEIDNLRFLPVRELLEEYYPVLKKTLPEEFLYSIFDSRPLFIPSYARPESVRTH